MDALHTWQFNDKDGLSIVLYVVFIGFFYVLVPVIMAELNAWVTGRRGYLLPGLLFYHVYVVLMNTQIFLATAILFPFDVCLMLFMGLSQPPVPRK